MSSTLGRGKVEIGKGVRHLGLRDIAPKCPIVINGDPYELKSIVAGKKVLDIGCGFGWNRTLVENSGGTWVGGNSTST